MVLEGEIKNKKLSEIFDNIRVATVLIVFAVLLILAFVAGQYFNYVDVYELAYDDIEKNILRDYNCLPKSGRVIWNESGTYDIPLNPPIEEKFDGVRYERNK